MVSSKPSPNFTPIALELPRSRACFCEGLQGCNKLALSGVIRYGVWPEEGRHHDVTTQASKPRCPLSAGASSFQRGFCRFFGREPRSTFSRGSPISPHRHGLTRLHGPSVFQRRNLGFELLVVASTAAFASATLQASLRSVGRETFMQASTRPSPAFTSVPAQCCFTSAAQAFGVHSLDQDVLALVRQAPKILRP